MPFGVLSAVLASASAIAGAPADAGGTTWSVRGAGWGHGVGMSQHGALGMAEAGRSHRRILRHFYRGTRLGRIEDRVVRVLLRERTRRVRFRGARRACGRTLRPAATYRAVQRERRVVLLTPSGGRLATCGERLRAEGGRGVELPELGGFRGALEVRRVGTRRVAAVNVVGLERYLRGVVPGEMPASWPPAALRAQAIAARTYAISTGEGGEAFGQFADVRSQVYLGRRVEHPRTDAAIRATRGQVVTYDGRPAVTFYHSTSGGLTEDAHLVFGAQPASPWLRGVEDPFDRVSPVHRWGPVTFSARAFDRRLGDLVRGTAVRIDVRRRGRVSPRILTATVVGSAGRRTAAGDQLRARLALRDTWASFARVTTYRARRALTGTVWPGGSVRLQRRVRGRWADRRALRVRRGGRYRAGVGRGRWRVVLRGWAAGPPVTVR